MRSFLPAVGWRSLRSGDVDTLGGRITGLPTPVEDSEAATKEYVDDSAGDNGGSIPSGSGSPIGSVVPTGIGELYVDSEFGALYIAIGATDADWIAVGGAAVGSSDYGVIDSGARLDVLGQNITQITDLAAYQGTGNGFEWNYNLDADGDQAARLRRGSSAQYSDTWNPDGTYTSAKGIILPTSDPHIAGALWNNGGTPAISAG